MSIGHCYLHLRCLERKMCRGYLKGNWFRSSVPIARSLRYISRYASWTLFRGAIIISHRDLIFVKKTGCLWLLAVGQFVPQRLLSPCFLFTYLSGKLRSRLSSCSRVPCLLVNSLLARTRKTPAAKQDARYVNSVRGSTKWNCCPLRAFRMVWCIQQPW